MSIQVSIVLNPRRPVEFRTDATPPWRSKEDSSVNNAIHFEGESWGQTGIQGPPSELRRLADALNRAAAEADAWAVDHPAEDLDRDGSL